MGRNGIDEEILKAVYNDHTQVEIATMFGVNTITVTRRLKKLGLKRIRHDKERKFKPPYNIPCQTCGKTFTIKFITDRYCKECLQHGRLWNKSIRRLRAKFYCLLKQDLNTAMVFRKDMIDEEGEEFASFVLDKIIKENGMI